jgi:hypothetical protein
VTHLDSKLSPKKKRKYLDYFGELHELAGGGGGYGVLAKPVGKNNDSDWRPVPRI